MSRYTVTAVHHSDLCSVSDAEWLIRDETRRWANVDLDNTPLSLSEQNVETGALASEETRLASSLSQAATLQESIRRRQVRIAAHRRLHNDHLEDIFLHLAARYIDEDADRDNFSFPCLMLEPPAIMTVCKRWRQVALSLPRLFSRMKLNPRLFSPQQLQRVRVAKGVRVSAKLVKSRLLKWILSSEPAPLTFSFEDARVPQETLRDIWETMLLNIRRVENLRCLTGYYELYTAFISNAVTADQLEFLEFNAQMWRDDDNNGTANPQTFPMMFPRLRSFTICVHDDLQLLRFLRINAPVLDVLTLRTTEVTTQHVGVLNGLYSTITKLDLFHDMDDATSSPPDQHQATHAKVLHLNRLTECRLSGTFSLQLLTGCDNLAVLDLKDGQFPPSVTSQKPFTLPSVEVLRFCPASHEFGYTSQSYSCHDFNWLLSMFPRLVELDGEKTKGFNVMIEELTTCDDLCPRLALLILDRCAISSNKLLALLVRRSETRKANMPIMLVTTRQCSRAPNVESADKDGLRTAIQQRKAVRSLLKDSHTEYAGPSRKGLNHKDSESETP